MILRWLIEHYRCEVVTFTADVGQEEELSGVPEKARATGAVDCVVRDVREEFVRDYVFPAVRGLRDLRGPLPARHRARAAADRQAPGRGRPRDRLRRRGARRDGQGQRPGALRARLPRARARADGDRAVARVGPALAHRLHRLRPEALDPGHGDAQEALLDGPQPDAHLLRGRDPRGSLARARRGHVHPDALAGARARRSRSRS